ncbi:hypothetical protein ABKN59_005040 [Abortiporus biennis]
MRKVANSSADLTRHAHRFYVTLFSSDLNAPLIIPSVRVLIHVEIFRFSFDRNPSLILIQIKTPKSLNHINFGF